MEWKTVLERIQESQDPEVKKNLTAWLHQEIHKGHLQAQDIVPALETAFAKEKSPGMSAEFKRMIARFRVRKLLGKDLLSMTRPPVSGREIAQVWEQAHELKSVYNETRQPHASDFESRYTLLNEIGSGGMSTVFKAVRNADGKEVAIKYLKPEFFSSENIRARFDRECRVSLGFDHPNVIDVLEIDRSDNAGFLVMEYIPKGGVDRLLDDPGLDLNLIVSIAEQTARALSYVHQQGIIHRDVKLSNLLVPSFEPLSCIHVKLTDFGICKDVAQDGLTIVGTRMGTDLYCAPEQIAAPEKVDSRSDIYAFGVCIYRLLTRSYPCTDVASVRTVRPDIPESLDIVLMKCLEHQPENRYACADELIQKITETAKDTAKDTALCPEESS